MAATTKKQGTGYDFKADWSPGALKTIYTGFLPSIPLNAKFNDYKVCKHLLSRGLYEQSMHKTLEGCYGKNTTALGFEDRKNAKGGYSGDEAWGIDYHTHLKTIKTMTEKKNNVSHSSDLAPRYPVTGIAILHTKEWEKDNNMTNPIANIGIGTLKGKDELVIVVRDVVYHIKAKSALDEINDIAKWYAMSKMAAFNGHTTQATNLLSQWNSRISGFASFSGK